MDRICPAPLCQACQNAVPDAPEEEDTPSMSEDADNRGQAPSAPAKGRRVLIVEDNELNLKLFHDLLEAYGYEPMAVRDGRLVMDQVRATRPDLIIMDIQLPEVSGLEVTRWLKNDPDLKSIPIIAVTAFAMKGDEERIREGGCEGYIAKPISVVRFLETVQRFLG